MRVTENFQEIRTSENFSVLAIFLNSAVSQLLSNMMGRSSFDGRLLKIQPYEVADLMIPFPSLIQVDEKHCENILNKFSDKCNKSLHEQPIHLQKPLVLPEREENDNITFDILNLTQQERAATYLAICELLKAD